MEDKKNKKEKEENPDLTFEEETEHTIEDSKRIIAKLRERLKGAESEKQEYLLGWQKERADYINVKKKEEEEKREFIKFAKSDLVSEIVPVLDSFDMAFANKNGWEKLPKEWRDGMEGIYSQLLGILKANGLSEFDPKGEDFDPIREEAVELVETQDESKDGKVLEVVRKGFLLHGKLIRSAKVKVGKFEHDSKSE